MTGNYNNYKPFEKKLSKKYDGFAKKISSEFLLSLKDSSGSLFEFETPLDQQTEKYKAYDYIINYIPEGKKVRVEVECKAVWTKRVWQYYPDNIHIPARKRDSRANIFIMVNKHGNSLCMCMMEDIKNSKVVVKSTKNRYNGTRTRSETFFSVPLDKFKFFYRDIDNAWKEQ